MSRQLNGQDPIQYNLKAVGYNGDSFDGRACDSGKVIP